MIRCDTVTQTHHRKLSNTEADLPAGVVPQSRSRLWTMSVFKPNISKSIGYTHVLELYLAIEIDKGGFEEIRRASDEGVVLGHQRLNYDST